jgi:predicted transposase/invertase (TIGR01784 family)
MENKNPRNLIRFDWALKRLLRDKANYDVLEGFLSVLLRQTVKIKSIGESEAEKTNEKDKFNRVDILAYNEKNEIIIIELQTAYEVDYYFRMVYGAAKAVTNHINEGSPYAKVRKIYHINIVYFEIGQGKDYVYHGTTNFSGIHYNDVLELTSNQKEYFRKEAVNELFPEFYILKVNDFDDNAKDSLDQWIYYLKNDRVPDSFTAPGLAQVRTRLMIDSLTEQDRRAYYHHLNQANYEQNVIKSNYLLGKWDAETRLMPEIEARDKAIDEQQKAIDEQQKAIDEQQKTLAEKDKEIANLRALLESKK